MEIIDYIITKDSLPSFFLFLAIDGPQKVIIKKYRKMFFKENKNSNGEQFEKNLSHKWPMPSGLCLSACLSVCLSVCLSQCLSIIRLCTPIIVRAGHSGVIWARETGVEFNMKTRL